MSDTTAPTTTTTAPGAPAGGAAGATLFGGEPAAKTPPPAAGAPATTAPGDAAGKPAAPWMKWDAERRGFYQNKGWMKGDELDIDQLAQGYEQLEKFKGVPPEEAYRISKNPTDEELARVHEKLGVPKDVAGYGLKAGEGQDPKVLEQIAKTALEAKATPAQVQAFVKLNQELFEAQERAQEEAEAAQFAQDAQALTRDWGGAIEQNKAIARRAASLPAFAQNGLDEGFWAAAGKIIGPGKVARALHALGVSLGEDTFVTGEPTGGGTRTPESATARLEEMMNHEPTRKALLAGDPKLLREKAALEEAIIAARHAR